MEGLRFGRRPWELALEYMVSYVIVLYYDVVYGRVKMAGKVTHKQSFAHSFIEQSIHNKLFSHETGTNSSGLRNLTERCTVTKEVSTMA